MILSVTKLKANPVSHDTLSSQVILGVSEQRIYDESICIGHEMAGDSTDGLIRYMVMERVADEIHEHLIVSRYPINHGRVLDRLVNLSELNIIRTKIYNEHGIHIVNHTGGITTTLQPMLDGAALPIVPIQVKALGKLRRDMLTGFIENTRATNIIDHFFDEHYKHIGKELPPSIDAIVNLVSLPEDMFVEAQAALGRGEPEFVAFLESMFLNRSFTHKYGLGFDSIYGDGMENNNPFDNTGVPCTHQNSAPIDIPSETMIVVNPHIRNTITSDIRLAYLELIDMFISGAFSEISITVDLLHTFYPREPVEQLYRKMLEYKEQAPHKQKVVLNSYTIAVDNTVVSTPREVKPTGSDLVTLKIDMHVLINLLEYIGSMYYGDDIAYGIGGKFEATVVKTANELMVIHFSVFWNGKDISSCHYLDTVISSIMSLALV